MSRSHSPRSWLIVRLHLLSGQTCDVLRTSIRRTQHHLVTVFEVQADPRGTGD